MSLSIEGSLGVLVELRDEGKVDCIGVSGATSELLAQVQRLTPIAAVQNRYNLIDRSGVEVLEACERNGIAFVPYFPLATGGVCEMPALAEPARRLQVSESTIALALVAPTLAGRRTDPGNPIARSLDENLRALDAARELTDSEVGDLTATEDESDAALVQIPTRMLDTLRPTV